MRLAVTSPSTRTLNFQLQASSMSVFPSTAEVFLCYDSLHYYSFYDTIRYMHKCDSCGEILKRHTFCNDKCRVTFFRNKGLVDISKIQEEKEIETCKHGAKKGLCKHGC